MSLLPAGIMIVAVAITAASLALAAFLWALRNKQFSLKHMNEGAYVIFDNAEKAGLPTDQVFKKPTATSNERTGS